MSGAVESNDRCLACNRGFKGSGGLLQHWRKTQNLACIALYHSRIEYSAHEPGPDVDDYLHDTSPFPLDPVDYMDVDDEYDLGNVSPGPPPDSDSDSDDDSADEGYHDLGPLAALRPDYAEPEATPATAELPRVPPVEARFVQQPHVTKFPGMAGAKLDTSSLPVYEQYQEQLFEFGYDPLGPFKSQMDWEIARWAKLRGSTSTAFTDLLNINGVAEKLGLSYRNSRELNQIIDDSLPSGRPIFQRHEITVGGEAFDVFYRPVLPCICALFGDPEFAADLAFAPERHYVDADKTIRLYHDIHTGKWWWATQKTLEALKPGATIVPVIISTDKTQTTMFRNKAAYPMYLTIGNIPKHIRRKPSRQAYILIGYLPTTRLEHIKVAAARRRALANLYHACVRKILQPLQGAGVDGVEMASGDGAVRRCHPILAIFAGDYPEQCLVAGVKSGECPTCPCPPDELGDIEAVYEPRDLEAVLEALAKSDGDAAEFTRACRDAGIKPIFKPFWEDLPFTNIYLSITPDVLHQLLQGVLKHVIGWVKEAYGAAQIDARCSRLPPNHNVRHFLKGITTLSRISGTEHAQICAILLGLIVDLRLPGGHSPKRLVRAVRGALDFLYYSEYPIHSSESLAKVSNALVLFHENKSIFVDLEIREHFNFPKLHNVSHTGLFIRLFGTLDNYNTEHTERLHIDFAKDAYRASNRKDEYFQMTLWLERKEKILRHDKFINWCRTGQTAPSPVVRPRIHMTKSPSTNGVRFDTLIIKYGAKLFREALARYIVSFNNPAYSRQRVERAAAEYSAPFRSVNVFHKIKFWNEDPFGRQGSPETLDVVHVRPSYVDKRGRSVPARFDTALINDGTGSHFGVSGYHVGQIRVVFMLPDRVRDLAFPGKNPPKHFAYVEFFSKFARNPERDHGMYKVHRPVDCVAQIIPIANIRRSVHLYPHFGPVADLEWTSSNVLETCKNFYVSPWSDRHAFVTVT